MRRWTLCLGAFVVLSVLSGFLSVAGAQSGWNRELQTMTVLPDEAGGHTVTAVWTVDVALTSVPLDLSTDVVFLRNGTAVASSSYAVQIDAGSGFGCEDGPPCTGSCGSGSVSGVSISLLCYEDGECTPTFCDCDCGYWINAEFELQTLQPGDEIMVILMPGPGALPDDDTTDNDLLTTFHGRPIGWNRSVDDIALVAVGTDLYDVQVEGSVGWESPTTYLNLDTTLELLVNGTTIAAQNIPVEVTGIYDQSCWVNGCGSSCGTVNGVPRYCDPYLWWDCACVGGWISIFPDVVLQPEDEIMVLLRPVPGALPELPGMNDDDEKERPCCDTVSVGEDLATPLSWRLDQNRPNPFNPATAIHFELSEGGPTRIDVFDLDGRHVRSLLDRGLGTGQWSVTWDGLDQTGARAASGTYFYRLELNGNSEMRKMTLLK